MSLLWSVFTYSWRESMCLSLVSWAVPKQKILAAWLSISSVKGKGKILHCGSSPRWRRWEGRRCIAVAARCGHAPSWIVLFIHAANEARARQAQSMRQCLCGTAPGMTPKAQIRTGAYPPNFLNHPILNLAPSVECRQGLVALPLASSH